MSRRVCLYGTVLNSADTVERSLSSAFRPEYERIVIVDAGSADGTYERLLELRKEFNLEVYRLPGASRGKGKDYALRRCPEGSYAANIDLDDEYDEWFHRSIEWGVNTGEPSLLGQPYFGLVERDHAIARGGWRDLNFAEDVEFFVRVGFSHHLPLIMARPIRPEPFGDTLSRELRYARGRLQKAARGLRLAVDLPRGAGLTLGEYLGLREFRSRPYMRPLGVLAYLAAYAMGVYRYERGLNNYQLLSRMALTNMLDPVEELGADRGSVFFSIDMDHARRLGLEWVVSRLREALPWAGLFACSGLPWAKVWAPDVGQLALAGSEETLKLVGLRSCRPFNALP